MKNPHGVEPTRYMKRKEIEYAIFCDYSYGPDFDTDISIENNCNAEDSCSLNNDGTRGYECHPQYKSSLFVNSNKPDENIRFTVLDYEVYSHN